MRVARAMGGDPVALASRPFAEVAWIYLTLLEVEEFDALKAEGDAINQAALLSIAFHEPKKLDDQYQQLLARMRQATLVPAQKAMDRARAMIERIRKGRVLDGD